MKIKKLRGAGQGRYISINNGLPLFSHINKYTGLRLKIEKLTLFCSRLFYSPFFTQSEYIKQLTQGLSILCQQFGKVDKGFLLDTSWYKDSYCVGSVYFSDTSVFFKYFKVKGLSNQEAERQLIVSKLYDESFSFSELLYVDDELIAYRLIPNIGAQCSSELMRAAAIRMYDMFLSTADQYCTLTDLSTQVSAQISCITLSDALYDQVVLVLTSLTHINDKLPLLFCHGDYTTWNTVIDQNSTDKHYLIDYECCELRVLYTDLFHLFTQKACLEGVPLNIKAILMLLSNDLEIELEALLRFYCAYLLEELLVNLAEWSLGKNHTQLFNLIAFKFQLLVDCYAYLQDEK